jgi:hypothetical protein
VTKELYAVTLAHMEATLRGFETKVPRPKAVPHVDGFVYRYTEKNLHQAIVQKLARVVSGLHACRVLLEHGFVQELAALQRTIDEFEEDVAFLSYAIIFDDFTDLHRRYLSAFYEEEFDRPGDPIWIDPSSSDDSAKEDQGIFGVERSGRRQSESCDRCLGDNRKNVLRFHPWGFAPHNGYVRR